MNLSGYTDNTPDISNLHPVALSRARAQAHALSGLGNADEGTSKDVPTMSFDEVMKAYNGGITDEEIKAWVYWKRSSRMVRNDFAFITSEWAKYIVPLGAPRNTSIQHWVETGIMFYHAGELLPLPIYAYGNIYDRIQQLEKDKEHIIATYGNETLELHKEALEKAKPRMLSLLHPDAGERPIIKAISDVANNTDIFSISTVREEYLDTETAEELKLKAGRKEVKHKRKGYREKTIVLDGSQKYPLIHVFKIWLFTLKEKDFRKSEPVEVVELYLNNGSIRDKEVSAMEKAERKQNARIEGEEKFAQFLHEVLTFEDQQKLDLIWNRLYNGWGELNYERVPVGFVCSQTFKNRPLQITPIQRQGIAFMEAMGSGINAFDVGVGKTMTAIATLAHMISTCKAERPIVVVPKPTYQKWLAEIGGYTDRKTGKYVTGFLSGTDISINDWFNLGTDTDAVLDKPVPARSITVVTYEGFKRIGLGNNVSEAMVEELAKILTQPGADDTARDKEQEKQKLREMIGIANNGTRCDVDTLGFDFVVIDEAHRCKNVFDRVAADEDEGSRYNMTGGQSATGVKAFLMLNYLQRLYGSCSMLLTATPFTNSPLEIYSMLSLVAYPNMVRQNIENIRDFFDLFVAPTLEYVVTARDQIETREVIKGFTNRILLQKLINGHILYRTGEEAGVTRPVKVNLPLLYEYEDEDGDGKRDLLSKDKRVLTYLKMTERQQANQEEIVSKARNSNVREDPGIMLRCLNWSLNNALSPYLYEGISPDSPEDLMEESPKLKFVMGCIATVKKWHESKGEGASGQVIYMNRGKDLFPLIKKYLEDHVGYKKGVPFESGRVDEVEIIESSVSEERKEKIKSAFLEGACKIIIGTATIREGIDLQKNGTVIYNCYPEWNPTDMRQLEGRIWRQGNRYKYVRIVMPLIQDSMDVFVFQKLEEKTARINDVWSKADRGNVLDVESLDPNEVKIALISDLDKLVKMEFDEERQEAQKAVKRAADDVTVIEGADYSLRRYKSRKESLITALRNGYNAFSRSQVLYNVPTYEGGGTGMDGLGRVFTESQKLEYKDAKKIYDKAVEIKEALAALTIEDDKALLALARKAIQANNTYFQNAELSRLSWPADEFKESLAIVSKFESTILKPKGYNLQSDLAPVKAEYEKVLAEKQAVSNEYPLEASKAQFSVRWQKLKEEIAEKKAALAIDGRPPEQRADEFSTLNDKLLSARRAEGEQREIFTEKSEPSTTKSSAEHNTEQEALAAIALMEMLELELTMESLNGLGEVKAAKLNHNTHRNGVEVKFGGQAPYAITQFLKGKGFRWSSRQGLWYVTYSAVLFDAVKTKLVAEGYAVNGEGGSDANPKAAAEAKKKLAEDAKLLSKARLLDYLDKYMAELELASMPFTKFARRYLSPDIPGRPSLKLTSGAVLTWDGKRGDFYHLPAGRKRPDRYGMAVAKEMLMRDAMKSGAIIPFTVYYETPGLQHNHHPDLQLSDIKSLISRYPQQAEATDYKEIMDEVERKMAVQKDTREWWAKYRAIVIPPLLQKGQAFWTKEKAKGGKMEWTKWACAEKPDELSKSTERGSGAGLALMRQSAWMQFHTTYPFEAIYLEEGASQTILDIYPINDVLDNGLSKDARVTTGDDESAAALALMEMMELELAL